MSTINDIADAFVTELNAHTFAASFTAVRGRMPQYALEDMGTLHVTVVPKSISIDSSVASRAHQQHDFLIDLAVQKKPANSSDGSRDDTAFDALDTLVEEIVDHFRAQHLTGYTSAVCKDIEYVVTESPENLEKYGLFESIVTFTFRKMR